MLPRNEFAELAGFKVSLVAITKQVPCKPRRLKN